jgi:hypothetical protein
MAKYRKKPVVIEAEQFVYGKTAHPAVKWGPSHQEGGVSTRDLRPYVETLEGRMFVSDGDWIIQGVSGEFYPCKPDIFAATYEPAE